MGAPGVCPAGPPSIQLLPHVTLSLIPSCLSYVPSSWHSLSWVMGQKSSPSDCSQPFCSPGSWRRHWFRAHSFFPCHLIPSWGGKAWLVRQTHLNKLAAFVCHGARVIFIRSAIGLFFWLLWWRVGNRGRCLTVASLCWQESVPSPSLFRTIKQLQ